MSDALREAAQQALDALENLQGGCTDSGDGTVEAITVWCPEVIDALRAALAQPAPQAAPTVPEGWALVPVEPTPEMVAAYLTANHAYWKEMDEGPAPINKWRNGTPAEATAESYVAMLAAAPQEPQR